MKRILVVMAVFLSFIDVAFAHPLDVAYLKLAIEGNLVAFELDLHPVMAQKLSPESSRKRGASSAESLFRATLGEASLWSGGHECLIEGPSLVEEVGFVRLSAKGTCPEIKQLKLSLPFLATTSSAFQLFLRADGNAARQLTQVLNAEKTFAQWDPTAESGVWDFIHLGIQHIGAVPSEWHDEKGWKLADGIDHIMFLLALVLGGGTLLGLAKTITGFTIGHSLTLALGAFGWVVLPSRFVESAIALSIAWVALSNLRGRSSSHRASVAFVFGLIHGLGFAAHLAELKLGVWKMVLALIAFNGGVELGQLIILACILPLLWGLRRISSARVVLAPGLATVLLIYGSYLFVERLFL